jgi:hypothetical protein
MLFKIDTLRKAIWRFVDYFASCQLAFRKKKQAANPSMQAFP